MADGYGFNPLPLLDNAGNVNFSSGASNTTAPPTQLAQNTTLPTLSDATTQPAQRNLPAVVRPTTGTNLVTLPGSSPTTIPAGTTNVNALGQMVITNSLNQAKDVNLLNEQVNTTHQAFNRATDGLINQVGDATSVLNDAYDKIGTARLVPAKIGHLLSIFGYTDLDADYQKLRIEKSAALINQKNQEVNALGLAAQSAENQAKFALSGQQTALQTGLSLAAEHRAEVQQGILLQQEGERRARVILEGKTPEQLAQIAANPGMAGNANITPGLIKQVQIANDARDTALSSAHAVLTSQNYQNTEKGMQLAEYQKQLYLTNLSPDRFDAERAAAKAAPNGILQVPVPGVEPGKAGSTIPISGQAYDLAYQSRQEAQIKHAKEIADVQNAAATNDVNQFTANSLSNNINNNPDARATLDPAALAGTDALTKGASSLAGSTDPNSILARQNMLKKATDEYNFHVKTILDSVPAAQQGAVGEHLRTGQIGNNGTASKFLASNMLDTNSPYNLDQLKLFGDNQSQFVTGDFYGYADKYIRDEMQKNVSQTYHMFGPGGAAKVGTNIGTAGLNKPYERPPAEQTFADTLNQQATDVNGKPLVDPVSKKPISVGQQAKSMLIQNEQELMFHNALLHLGNVAGLPAFKALISGNDISSEFKTANGNINHDKILEHLATQDQLGVNGPLAGNMDTLKTLLNQPQFRQSFEKFEKQMGGSTAHAAMRKLFLDNNPSAYAASPLVREVERVQRTLPQIQASHAQGAAEAAALSNPAYAGGNIGINAPDASQLAPVVSGIINQLRNQGNTPAYPVPSFRAKNLSQGVPWTGVPTPGGR